MDAWGFLDGMERFDRLKEPVPETHLTRYRIIPELEARTVSTYVTANSPAEAP